MFDIGPGEILVILVAALLVVGPDRLPGLLADLTGRLRTLRGHARTAREELTRAADLDGGTTASVRGTLAELRELSPRRIASGVLGEAAPGSSPGPAWASAAPQDPGEVSDPGTPSPSPPRSPA